MSKLHIKKGDTVYVNAGENKGATGKVLKVLVEKQRAIVEGINMYRSLLLHDSTLGVLCAGLLALGYHINTLYDGTLLLNENLKHLTSLALVLTGQDHDCIVFSDM